LNVVMIGDQLSYCQCLMILQHVEHIIVPGRCCRSETQGRACPRCLNDIMVCLRKPRSGMNGLVLTAAASCRELQSTLQWMNEGCYKRGDIKIYLVHLIFVVLPIKIYVVHLIFVGLLSGIVAF